MPKSGWQGRGWFRLHVDVDSSLWHEPVTFLIYQAGSSSIYCDGKLTYDNSTSNDTAYKSFVSMTLGEGARHVIAVRYENESTQYFHTAGRAAGFYFAVGLPDVVMERSETSVRTDTAMQMFFTAMALVFAMLHFTLFWFSPKADGKRIARNNLYFALFALFTAANVFFDYQHGLVPDLRSHVFFLRIHRAAMPFGNIFALLFIYSLFEERIPKQFWILTAALLLSGAFATIKPIDNLGYVQLLGVVAAAECARVIGRAIKRKRAGAWTITFGFMLLFLFSVYDILVDQHVIGQLGEIRNGYPAGFLGLFTCMSMYLARDFARANQKILEQERLAKEKELERRLLEADNARKTKELEDARQVQLSMLPKQIPSLPHLDIAVEMNTATEVGGDYYDFHLADDGTLTVALGDATGHGMRAGTMVSVAKALFHELATQPSIPTIFERFTQGIKSMNFSQLYMALMLVRIKNHKLEASSAGMPPMLVFRAATQNVEVVTMKGMPLGKFNGFPYQTNNLTLASGDTILLMSDGFTEMFNQKDETFDAGRAVDAFISVGSRSPREIINHLVAEATKWADGRPQADDVTFVVMKIKA
jgi:serine phosphatase RsbU (regulator of sigma subunit)